MAGGELPWRRSALSECFSSSTLNWNFVGFGYVFIFSYGLFLCIAQAHCRIFCVAFCFIIFDFIYFPIQFGSIQILILATKDLEFAAHYSELACITWQRIILLE